MSDTRVSLPKRQTSHDTETPKSIYCRYIKSCFSRSKDAAPYYAHLVEYLESGAASAISPLQSPKYQELKGRHLSRTGSIRSQERSHGADCPNPRIVVLEGFPSPECISSIGASEMVRPELFIGHLDNPRRSRASGGFFELPALPSDRSNIIHVRLVCMGRNLNTDPGLESQAHYRAEAARKTVGCEEQLFMGKYYGTTRFRKVHLHNSQVFSVEQMVSFTVTQRKNRPWCGVFLLDRGTTLNGRHNLPWSAYTSYRLVDPDVIPVVPYNSSREAPNSHGQGPNGEGANGISLHDYHPLEDLNLQDDSELALLRHDPFYLLSILYKRAARSWLQLLNFIGKDVDARSRAGERSLSPALEQLRFNASLIARVEAFCAENLHVIHERGGRTWPRSAESELETKMLVVQASLIQDYGFLISRCSSLAETCKTGIRTLVSAAQLIEAQKGTDQARRVHELTRLAFIFIPLTFVASMFGMNVSVFREYPPIWLYFIIAIPLTTLSWFLSGLFGNGKASDFLRFVKWRSRQKRIISHMANQVEISA